MLGCYSPLLSSLHPGLALGTVISLNPDRGIECFFLNLPCISRGGQVLIPNTWLVWRGYTLLIPEDRLLPPTHQVEGE